MKPGIDETIAHIRSLSDSSSSTGAPSRIVIENRTTIIGPPFVWPGVAVILSGREPSGQRGRPGRVLRRPEYTHRQELVAAGSRSRGGSAMDNETGTLRVKTGLAEMLKGGVIMDVTTAEQAKIAEDAGACAVMALERVPADIRREGGVARMADPTKVAEIMEAVSIPVMAKCRIGHFVEAQILQALGVDYVDESEVLTPADEEHHVNKWDFTVPFVCGARDLGEALRRISEGAAMIRTKGEAGTGDVVEAVRHMRKIQGQIRHLGGLRGDELVHASKELSAPLELVRQVAATGKLPVVNFAA